MSMQLGRPTPGHQVTVAGSPAIANSYLAWCSCRDWQHGLRDWTVAASWARRHKRLAAVR